MQFLAPKGRDHPGERRAGAPAVLALLGAAALIASNAFLILRNRELNAELRDANRSLLPPIGRTVPSLLGVEPDGKKVAITYGLDPRVTLLFVVSPHCAYCSATWPAWERVLASTDQRKFRPVVVSAFGGLTPTYLAGHHLAGALVIESLESSSWLAYNLTMTPDIIEIGPHGLVRNAWVGELNSATESKLVRMVKQGTLTKGGESTQ